MDVARVGWDNLKEQRTQYTVLPEQICLVEFMLRLKCNGTIGGKVPQPFGHHECTTNQKVTQYNW